MNEYAARSMLMDIAGGQRIVVVERDGYMVRQAVDVFAAESERVVWGATVRRTEGAERVQHPGGGWIAFATPRGNRLRGVSADVVFIDNDAHRVFEGAAGGIDFERVKRFRADVAGVLAASRNGKVVHS